MTLSVLPHRSPETLAVGIGLVAAIGGASVCVGRTLHSGFSPMSMGAMPAKPSTTRWPLSGMPVASMPEMFIAIAGLLLIIAAAFRYTSPSGLAETTAQTNSAPATAFTRYRSLVVLTAALVIDVSKTSTLGFVVPGMRAEYGLGPRTGSLLAVAGLSGCMVGALIYAAASARVPRRTLYVIAMTGFVITSSCGSMPSFADNVVMCASMGLAVGMIAPLLVGAIADVSPGGLRGATGTSCSIFATAGGFLIASASATWLIPLFGWRIMWLIGVPTGALLLLGARWVPDRLTKPALETVAAPSRLMPRSAALAEPALALYAVISGVVAFGLTTWLPTLVTLNGLSPHRAAQTVLIAAAVMIPFGALIMVVYRSVGPVWIATVLAGVCAVVLVLTTVKGFGGTALVASGLVAAVFLSNCMGSVFLPIAAARAAVQRPGRTLGWISACYRFGGLLGPLFLASLVGSPTGIVHAVRALAIACAVVAVAFTVLAKVTGSRDAEVAGPLTPADLAAAGLRVSR